MTQIINVRQPSAQLVSLSIREGKHITTTPQSHLLHDAQAYPLDKMPTTHHSPQVIDAGGAMVVPSALDCHVHSRCPGHPDKEDWDALTQSAMFGGVDMIFDMPNTQPPTLFEKNIQAKIDLMEKLNVSARFFLGCNHSNLDQIDFYLEKYQAWLVGVKVYYGNSTGDMLFRDLPALSKQLQNLERRGQVCVFHSEDQCRIDRRSYLENGKLIDHSIVRDDACAWGATREILTWLQTTPIPAHIAHVSTAEEVEMIHEAKAQGARITYEVCPHHLIFSTDDYAKHGSMVKVNPPVRSPHQRDALRRSIAKYGLDCFATDHAPHTIQEKNKPYPDCPSGIPAVEFFYPLLFHCASLCQVELEEAVAWVTRKPQAIFMGHNRAESFLPEPAANLVFMEEKNWQIKAEHVKAKSAWSPYVGTHLNFAVKAHLHRGKWYSRTM